MQQTNHQPRSSSARTGLASRALELLGISRPSVSLLTSSLRDSKDPEQRIAAARALAGNTDHAAVLALGEAIQSQHLPLSFVATNALADSLAASERQSDTGAVGHVAEKLIEFLKFANRTNFRNQRLNAAQILGLSAQSTQRAQDYILGPLLHSAESSADELHLALRGLAAQPDLWGALRKLEDREEIPALHRTLLRSILKGGAQGEFSFR